MRVCRSCQGVVPNNVDRCPDCGGKAQEFDEAERLQGYGPEVDWMPPVLISTAIGLPVIGYVALGEIGLAIAAGVSVFLLFLAIVAGYHLFR